MFFMNKLVRAAATGDDDEVTRLLAAGQSPNDVGLMGSPIHEASRRGHAVCVRLLCSARADIKQRDAVTNETPLHCAVVFGHVEVAKILVEAGSDLNAQDIAGGEMFAHRRDRIPQRLCFFLFPLISHHLSVSAALTEFAPSACILWCGRHTLAARNDVALYHIDGCTPTAGGIAHESWC
jgi:ankyrin repeat protein